MATAAAIDAATVVVGHFPDQVSTKLHCSWKLLVGFALVGTKRHAAVTSPLVIPEQNPLTVTTAPVRQYETLQLVYAQVKVPEPCPRARVDAPVDAPLKPHEITPVPESLTITPLPAKSTDWNVGVVARPGEIVPEPASTPDPVEAAAGITPIDSANTEIIVASSVARLRAPEVVMAASSPVSKPAEGRPCHRG